MKYRIASITVFYPLFVFFYGPLVFAQKIVESEYFIIQSEIISKQTPESILEEFLKENRAKDIEYNHPDRPFPMRIKKNDGWALLEPKWDYKDSISKAGEYLMKEILIGYYLYEKKTYSLQFPDSLLTDYYPMTTTAEKDGKFYLAELDTTVIKIQDIWFDEIAPVIEYDVVYLDDPETMETTEEEYTFSNFLKLSRADRWALFGYSDLNSNNQKQLIQLTGFQFERNEEIPYAKYKGFIKYLSVEEGILEYDTRLVIQAKEYFKNYPDFDQIQPLTGARTENQLFLAHSAKTSLWSVLGSHAISELTHPSGVSRLTFHSDSEILEVQHLNKVGLHSIDLSKSLPYEYDEFQSVFLDAFTGCALRRSDLWELYDCQTLSKLVDGSAQSIDALIDLWLNR